MNTTQKMTWFSLIEVMIWILVVSIIMVWAFQTLTSAWIWKIKIVEKTSIEKEAFFLTEKLFEIIKKWGTIDYEEYWNRSVINLWPGAVYASGHYVRPSGFGNFWRNGTVTDRSDPGNALYYCISPNGSSMGTGWCLTTNNIQHSWVWVGTDYSWNQQRYRQYSGQFIDYNSDADSDVWDEDGLSISTYGWFFGDDDDLFLGIWPEAFDPSWRVQELYLINKNTNERTLLRWNVLLDPFAPTTASCTGTQNMTWSGCLWTIEILKLNWLDKWYDHAEYSNQPVWGASENDGVIDTWVIHEDYDPNYWNNSIGAYTNMDYMLAHNGWDGYWQSLFSDKVHVKDIEFYLFPNKDPELSWRDSDPTLRVAPYVQLKMTLSPSWKIKRKIQWEIPDINIATTIQLSELNFK